MRTLVHLSDPHFGRADPSLLQPLAAAAHALRPDLVVVSGDLTQRARVNEFRQARRFLDTLPQPQIVVPGNHDVPLYNPLARFINPLSNYRRLISEEVEPFYADGEIAVAGINTSRSWTHKGGRVSHAQIARLRERFATLPVDLLRIVVTHHPFDLPEGHSRRDLVGRARLAMAAFAEAQVDLLLAGHMHLGQTVLTSSRYPIDKYSALVIQASTAISTRGRGEPNSFNVIQAERDQVGVLRYSWQAGEGRFAQSLSEQFERTPAGWSRLPSPDVSTEARTD
jgi:3',5'-cyclic AMP phosphodiesterase CpdA